MEEARPRTALVAGGTGALGRAVVDALLTTGEQVCVPWVDAGEAEAMRSRHAEAVADGRLRLSQCNVADGDQVAALLDVLCADWGPLWLACSLAGGWAGGTNVEDLDDLALVDRMMTLNLRTAFGVAREGLRHMGPDGGRIALVSSATVERPAPGQAAYTAAKAGVLSLVQTLALELTGSGRTANALIPTVIDTPANWRAMPDSEHKGWVAPEAIANVVCWLTSTASGAVNGATLRVPG